MRAGYEAELKKLNDVLRALGEAERKMEEYMYADHRKGEIERDFQQALNRLMAGHFDATVVARVPP